MSYDRFNNNIDKAGYEEGIPSAQRGNIAETKLSIDPPNGSNRLENDSTNVANGAAEADGAHKLNTEALNQTPIEYGILLYRN